MSAASHADGIATRPGHRLMTWGTLCVLAWFVYEVTAEPLLGPALGGVKIAWDDCRLAWWLRRRDPDAQRGRIAFWLYTSWGLLKLFVFALVIMMLVSLLHEIAVWFGAAAVAAQSPSLVGATLTWLVALIVLPVLTLPACRGARRLGFTVWVNTAVDGARRRDEWPPQGGRFNCFVFVVLGTTGALLIGPLAALVLLTMAVDDRAVHEAALIAVVIASLPMAVCSFHDKLGKWLLDALFPDAAAAPAEFWDSRPDANQN